MDMTILPILSGVGVLSALATFCLLQMGLIIKSRLPRQAGVAQLVQDSEEAEDDSKKLFERWVQWHLYGLRFESRISAYFGGKHLENLEIIFQTSEDWASLQKSIAKEAKEHRRNLRAEYGEYDDLPKPIKPSSGGSDEGSKAQERAQEIFDNDQEGYFDDEEG